MLTGGPTRPPAIGTADALYQARARQVGFDLFVVGACLVVGLLFLVLFATRPRERGFAWFGGLCVSIAFGSAHLRSEEHTSELQSLMRISYAVFCLKKTITA